MKTKFDWVSNLWEVGGPIREEAESIAWEAKQADEAFARAQKLHAEHLAEIAHRAERLEATIAELWSPTEIAAAKRGVMLVNGETTT